MALTFTEAEVQNLLRKENGKGLAEYTDSVAVSFATGQAITARTKLECDGAGSTTWTDELPPTGALWDVVNDKILGAAVGDGYDVRVEFKAQNTAPVSWFDVEFDIGGSVGVVSARTYTMPKGAATTVEFSVGLPLYSLATFITNGCTIYITPNTGTLTMWDIKIFIKRDYVA